MTLTPEKYILKRRGVRRGFETGTINGLSGDTTTAPEVGAFVVIDDSTGQVQIDSGTGQVQVD